MTTICPKCRMIRPENTDAPSWQCPGCGVAYVKASAAMASPPFETSQVRPHYAAPRRGIPWGKWLSLLVLAWGIYATYQVLQKRSGAGDRIGSIASRLGARPSPDQLAALAASARPDDVLIYSADWCPNCREAKNWMAQYGFQYEQCDIDKGAGCQAQLASLGGDGIPYLVVKGHHMRDGFDSDEFIAAMQAR